MREQSCEISRHMHIGKAHTTDILTMKKEMVAEQWENLASRAVVPLAPLTGMNGMLQVSKVKPCTPRNTF